MHSALLIDEILRLIFSFSETDQPSLIVAARSCKAWRDPALDFLWHRLSSFKPLLLLLPGSSIVNGQYVLPGCLSKQDLFKFKSYARRIKHFSNRQELLMQSSTGIIASFEHLEDNALPNLSTAHISVPRCAAILVPFYFSPNLSRLDIDLGFKATPSAMNDTLCEYLERVAESCHHLRHISLRGQSSERLNDIVARMSKLHSVSLRLGTTLLSKTLKAIMDFPRLSELEIHAGHIEFIALQESHEEYTILPSLRKLRIRAQAAFVEQILYHVPHDTLQHLRIELDDPSPCTTFWNTCFTTIANKAANTLNHLSLEHFFELIEPSALIPSDTVQPSHTITITTNTASSPTTSCIPFEVLETLRGLKYLRHFSCDITLPPTVTDQDIEKMVVWWPHLQHFELGSSLQYEELETVKPPQMTPGCLQIFASRSSQLQKLILPLAINDTAGLMPNTTQPAMVNQVQSLTIAQLTTATPNDVARYLHALFPSLKNLEGPCDDSKVWTETVDALRNLSH